MDEVADWLRQEDPVALATVISTWGSAPRPAGSRMAISRSGRIAGSVSGGCLEGEVFEQAQRVLKGGPAQLFHYGVSDDLAWTVGLSCGGEVDVLVEPLTDVHRQLMAALREERPTVLETGVDGVLGARRLLAPGDPQARDLLIKETPARIEGRFLEPFPRPHELIVVGGSHVAIPLTRLAKELGFRVTVIDARAKFADPGRFPRADRVIQAWPDDALQTLTIDASTFIAILTHDPKFDDPAIRAALQGGARYVGAIGSRKTHRERVERLRAAGVPADRLHAVHAPIGLDLGSQTAEETALAILGEMVAVRHGRAGVSMRDAARAAS